MKEMIALGSVCLSFVFILPVCGDNPALVERMWSEDFENGTISGWSSYPPFEDTAYDYTILCGYYRKPYSLQGYVASGEFFYPVDLAPPPGPGENQFYCLRAYRPNSVSPQRIGFTRKISLYAAENSSLSFDYWVKLTAGAVNVRVELAGADGRRYTRTIINPRRERWRHVNLPLSSFRIKGRSLPSRLRLQAVAVIAQFNRGDPSAFHYFAIDNVRLNGFRRAGFTIHKPATHVYEHWPLAFSQRHFYPGDRLTVEVTPDTPVREVTARIENFDSHPITENVKLSKHGDQWVGKDLYRFSEQDPRGPLKLVLTGNTATREVVRSDMRLWYLDRPALNDHPRLFFSKVDLKTLRKRTQTGQTKPIWDKIVRQAKNARAVNIPVEGQIQDFYSDYLIAGIEDYYQVLRSNSAAVFQNALVYAIAGEEKAGRYAKSGLLKMANWKQWVHPWFRTQGRKTYYPVGIAAMELGMAYDLVYPLLNESERAAVRQGILRNGITNSWEEYFVDDRIPNHTSNWISHCTAGPLVALLAFYGELNGEDAQDNGEPYFSGLAEKFLAHIRSTLQSDGGYGEGYGYQNFTMSTAGPLLAALDTGFGVHDLSTQLHFDRAYLYPLYISHDHTRELLDMGDSSGARSGSSNWAWFVRHHRDPILQWFYKQAPGDSFADFLWRDDTVPSQSAETLPPSRVFPEKGNVVLRTGWTDDDIIFNFRAGPNYNHTHMDQGTFRLWAYGENLATEAGPGGYYTDPYYWSFIIQSGGHNVVLIDENPESQEIGDFNNEITAFNNHARLEQTFLSDPVCLIRAQLGMLYRGMLREFTRRIYFIDSRIFVFYDTLRSASGPHHYQWQLFPPQKRGLTVHGSTALYEGDHAWLHIQVVSPDRPALHVKETPISIGDYRQFPARPLQPRAVLQVTQENSTDDQEFLVILTPGRTGEQKPERIERIDAKGYKGVRIFSHGRTDTLYFAVDGRISGVVSTDGPSAYVGRAKDRIVAAAAEAATSLKIEDELFLSSEMAVTASFLRNSEGETWTVRSDQPGIVRLRTSESGKAVLSGDGRLKNVEGRFRVIDIRAGKITLQLIY